MNKAHVAVTRSAMHPAMFFILLWLLAPAANALTSISSFTSDPRNAVPGELVRHSVVVTTDAPDLTFFGSSYVLRRDGVIVDSGSLNLVFGVAGNNYTAEFTLPGAPGLYDQPGDYLLDLSISGTEPQELEFDLNRLSNFTVAPALVPIEVTPASLELEGGPGESPVAGFTITAGTGPFQLTSANAEGRGTFSNASPALGEPVDYSFRIPGVATTGDVFFDTITVLAADGEQTTVTARITAVVAPDPITQDDIDEAMENIATTPPQRATAAAIATVCPSGSAQVRLQQDCDAVVGAALQPDGSLEQQQAANALAQITTDQVTASVDAAQIAAKGQLRNLGSRIVALRGGAAGFSSRGLALNLDGQSLPAGELADAFLRQLGESSGGAAGSDSAFEFGRLGVFVNGQITKSDRDATQNSAGFEADLISLTLGADYRFRDDLVAGVALGYSSADTDIDERGGDLESSAYHLSVYGTHYRDSGLYLDGMITFGRSDFEQRRNIRYTIGAVDVDQVASADFDGSEISASVGGGFAFSRGALSYGPTFRLEYVKSKVDAFDETMSDPTANGGGWATRIESQDFTSFTSRIGGEMSYAVSTSWGVLLPNAQLEWVHEFEDNAGDVVGYFLQDSSQTRFSLPTDDLDQNYFNLGVGVSAQFAKGRSAYLNYRRLLGYDDLDVYTVNAGMRIEF